MADRATFKVGDLEPPLEVQLLDGATAVNLSNAVGVDFVMRDRVSTGAAVGVVRARGAMAVADQALRPGVVTYRWQPGDTDRAGVFSAEVRVTWPGDRPQTFPSRRYLLVELLADLHS